MSVIGTSWRDHAACLGADPEIFFARVDQTRNKTDKKKAKAYCRGCSVVAECLQDALDHRDRDSIRGGMTPRQRRSLLHDTRRGETVS